MSIGHLATFSTPGIQVFDDADTGFANEQAHARITRLCDEEGIPVVFPAGTGTTAAMGPQRPMAFLHLLGEAADADMGVLFESRSVSRLAYRRRRAFQNQPVAMALDYALDGDVAPPLEPVDDDQSARNDITVGRTNGSSVHIRQTTGRLSVLPPPNGIGPVPGGGTYTVASDDQLPDMAGWIMHLGTWDQARYPSVSIDLAAGPHLIDAALQTDIGDRLTIANPPPECGGIGDTLNLIAQGYTETLGAYDWDITYNCTPAGPWSVNVIGDPVLGRIDSGTSTLNTALTSVATSVPVAVAAGGTLWSTNPADAPFTVRVSGEDIRVDAVGSILNGNPYLDTDLSGWAASTATIAPSTAQLYKGAARSMLIAPNGSAASGGANSALTAAGTVTAGASYIACMWAYSPGGWADLRAAVDWY